MLSTSASMAHTAVGHASVQGMAHLEQRDSALAKAEVFIHLAVVVMQMDVADPVAEFFDPG